MNAQIGGCINGLNGWMDELDGWINGQTNGQMDIQIDG